MAIPSEARLRGQELGHASGHRLSKSQVALFGLLACAIVAVFAHRILQTPFDTDESQYLNQSVSADAWLAMNVAPLLERAPEMRLETAPLTPLIAGLSRRLADIPLGGPFRFPDGNPDPLASAIMPAPELLLQARYLMAMAGIASTCLLSALAWRARGVATGLATGLMLIGNVTYVTSNQRVLTEAPLLLMTTLAFIAASRAARRSGVRWAALTGVLAGLALAAKHTGLLTVVAAAGTVGLGTGRTPLRKRVTGVAALVAAAALTVITLNPFSWSNPITAVVDVAAVRLRVTASQRQMFPSQALSTPLERVNTTLWRVFTHGATLGCAQSFARAIAVDPATGQWTYGTFVPAKALAYTPLCIPELGATPVIRPLTAFNIAWFLMGLAVAFSGARRRRQALVALGWGALYSLVTVAVVQFSWGHYYALPLVFATLIQAVALGAGVDGLLRLARRGMRGSAAAG